MSRIACPSFSWLFTQRPSWLAGFNARLIEGLPTAALGKWSDSRPPGKSLSLTVGNAILANAKGPVSALPIQPEMPNIDASLAASIQRPSATTTDAAKTSAEQKKRNR
jgi:hypothetical protein